MKAYKLFTHDLRSPLQGGDSVWDGSLPYQLPRVKVDRSGANCGAGWNACLELHDALSIGGLWPRGRPSRVFLADSGRTRVVVRADKCRTATWLLESEVGEEEVRVGVVALSQCFGDLADEMCGQQMLWRAALARPSNSPAVVEDCLHRALTARHLNWTLKRFDSAWAARDARAAWDARAARVAWDAW
ncbi:MAG: hypothetical protein KAY24_06860, partial [Candidatus Eisenbacteria sp.]|nr:hypothetical protein [Candidatus Eisenbacteria bacterium]